MHQDHCYICLAYCLLHSFAIISSKSWLVRGSGGGDVFDNCQKYCLNQNEKSCFFWWGKGSNISGGAEWQITSVPPIRLLIGLLCRVSCQPSSSPCSKGIVIERENSDLMQRTFLDKKTRSRLFLYHDHRYHHPHPHDHHHKLTTSMICWRVRPKVSTTASDSLTAGRSSWRHSCS